MASEEQKESDVDVTLAKLEKIKDKGNDYFKRKEYHDAITRYDIAIEEYKSFISSDYDKSNTESVKKMKTLLGSIYNNRAFAYFRLEMFGQTVLDTTQSIKLGFWKAYYRRGCANMALARLSKAKKDFEKALEKFPKNKDIKTKLKFATKAWQQEKFFQAIATEVGKPVSETIKLDDFADPSKDESYDGPKLIADDISSINDRWIQQLHEYQRNGKTLHIRYVVIIMLEALKILKSYKNVEFFDLDEEAASDCKDENDKNDENAERKNTVTICGDVHGQYYDYLHIYKLNGLPSKSNAYLFNGDFVDRGSWSCEVILSMLALKVLYPSHFMMTRGNHETINMNNMYGFKGEVEHKYSSKVFDLFTEIFNALPLAYVLGHKIFVCHGGLMKKEGVTIDEIQKINRFQQPEEGVMTDILWSDPQEMKGLAPSKRGGGTMFGPDVTQKFLSLNNLELIVRSHEVQEEGYKVLHDGKLITIFSAPNYVDQMGNKAAFITLDKEWTPKFTQFEAQKHPDLKPMAYGAGAMNMSNFFM
eukprot:CAMPEP_0197029642 /NCGR_PEP_ID=MMETSP1384-20130603/9048_1 /TAXON_ID=29189 /ORGANISM="Ammonia sp." /LENGTH=531 /DNA_ID=CAMNT_0042458849 /DNA_START=61 /DNA_END=1656 /DNA_ORIENTATION=+